MLELSAQETALDAQTLRDVERAVAELRRGAPILVQTWDGTAAIVSAAEAATDQSLELLTALSGTDPLLLLTRQRAAALGIELDPSSGVSEGVIALVVSGPQVRTVIELSDPTVRPASPTAHPLQTPAPMGLGPAAISLVKIARLLPAALMAPLGKMDAARRDAFCREHDLLQVSQSQVSQYGNAAARNLLWVADAQIPLVGAENTRVIAFRPQDGGVEHLAIVIGAPKAGDPLLVRLHSECFTGDLLGSLRCDCGDQLRGAIEAIGKAGAGVLLYLTQEGRGIGLVNKLRAYTLQDRGADTLDANEILGFDADERVFLPAAEMLRQLGFNRVRLLTNNPEKVAALSRCGIIVEERVAHAFPSNGHNAFYLATKASRFGHLF